jgi:hypothetical protein
MHRSTGFPLSRCDACSLRSASSSTSSNHRPRRCASSGATGSWRLEAAQSRSETRDPDSVSGMVKRNQDDQMGLSGIYNGVESARHGRRKPGCAVRRFPVSGARAQPDGYGEAEHAGGRQYLYPEARVETLPVQDHRRCHQIGVAMPKGPGFDGRGHDLPGLRVRLVGSRIVDIDFPDSSCRGHMLCSLAHALTPNVVKSEP